MKNAEKMYTNEITSALEAFMKDPHTAEEWANMDDDQRTFWEAEKVKMAPRKLEALWRFASEGSVTRDGGRIEQASSEMKITLDSGDEVRLALVGDYVVYPDGTRTRIISGAGDCFKFRTHSFALVDSVLENGDVIISTPQRAFTLNRWDNSEPLPANFLKPEVLDAVS